MKKWCLRKDLGKELYNKVKSGELSFTKLKNMTSEERTKALSFLGDEAKKTNIEFEKKVILKDVNRGLDSWLSSVSGVSSVRVERMKRLVERRKELQMKKLFDPSEEKRFLNQLASAKVGVGISYDEAKMIYTLSKKVANGKELFDKKTIASKLQEIKQLNADEKKFVTDLLDRISEVNTNKKLTTEFTSKAKADIRRYLGEGASKEQKDQLENLVGDIIKERTSGNYGVARVTLQNFVDGIKLENGKNLVPNSAEDFLDAGMYGRIVIEFSGFLKSVASSIDASFPGRQGWYALTSGNIPEWFRTLKNTYEIARKSATLPEVVTVDGKKIKISQNTSVLDGVKASILNRELGRNGIYDKMEVDLGTADEAFPSSLPEKIPFFGRFFKASNETYTGTAYLLRADLADKYYAAFKKAKGAELDKTELKSIGRLVNSMTGRGNKGFLGSLGKRTNVLLFSPKFIQSQIDKVMQPLDASLSPMARKQAALNLGTSIITMGGMIYGISKTLEALGVDASFTADPKDSSFGKVKIGDYAFDVSGGMAGYVTIMARTYALSTGKKYQNEITGIEATSADPVEGLNRFFLNKTSPFARTLIDIARGSDFNGNAVGYEDIKEDPANTLMIIGRNLSPITLNNFVETIMTDRSGVALSAIALETLGFSTNKYVFNPHWDTKTAKDLQAFKDKVGRETFKKAEEEFALDMHTTLLGLNKQKAYPNLPQEDKTRVLNALIRDKKTETFKKYGFEYEQEEELEDVRDIMDTLGL